MSQVKAGLCDRQFAHVLRGTPDLNSTSLAQPAVVALLALRTLSTANKQLFVCPIPAGLPLRKQAVEHCDAVWDCHSTFVQSH